MKEEIQFTERERDLATRALRGDDLSDVDQREKDALALKIEAWRDSTAPTKAEAERRP